MAVQKQARTHYVTYFIGINEEDGVTGSKSITKLVGKPDVRLALRTMPENTICFAFQQEPIHLDGRAATASEVRTSGFYYVNCKPLSTVGDELKRYGYSRMVVNSMGALDFLGPRDRIARLKRN